MRPTLPVGRPARPARRALAGLLALPVVAVALAVPGPAQAMDAEMVCVSWYQVGWSTTNEKGEELYVIEARCNGWMSFGGGTSTDQPPKGWEDGGGGTVDPTDKAYCDTVEREVARLRQQIASARQHIGQARADLASYQAQASADYAQVLRYRAELDQATAEFEDARSYYEAHNDTTVEREVKSGVVITVHVGVNPWGDGGRELMTATDDVNRAQAAYDAVWDRWSRHSDPAFQAAQRTVDAYQDLIDNGPTRLEELQRELHDYCE